MNYVSGTEVQQTISEIQCLIKKGNLTLNSLKDINDEIKINTNLLKSFHAKKVLGSNDTKITLEKIEHTYKVFVITGTDEIKSYSSIIEQECDMLLYTLAIKLMFLLVIMEESAEIISIYLKKLTSELEGEEDINRLSFAEKIQYIPKIIEKDANNNYIFLNSTPILKEGPVSIGGILAFDDDKSDQDYVYNGEYLSFYNKYGIKTNVPLKKIVINEGKVTEIDFTTAERNQFINTSTRYYSEIMSLEDQHGDNFYNETSKKLKNLVFCYPDYEKTWGAYTYGDTIVVDLKNASIEGKNKEFYYQSSVGAYTHELGHIYDWKYINESEDFSNSDSWLQVYEQVKKVDADGALMGTYAHTNPSECFAEAIHEYFGTGNYPGIANYSSNDLKAIEIDVDGYDNLYDYMDNLLSNGG